MVVDTHHNARGINVIDHAATQRLHCGTRVNRNGTLYSSSNQRFLCAQTRHCLPLHVRSHERPIRIIVFQERNQRGCNGDNLRRCNVHELNTVSRHQAEFVAIAARNDFVQQLAFVVDGGIGLGNHILPLIDGRKELDVVCDLAIGNAAIRGLEKPVFISARIQRK